MRSGTLDQDQFTAAAQETKYAMMGHEADVLYRSNLVNERVSALAILGGCRVEEGDPSKLAAFCDCTEGSGKAKYFCAYVYDHLTGYLVPVPPA
jgi:hypothetical protein